MNIFLLSNLFWGKNVFHKLLLLVNKILGFSVVSCIIVHYYTRVFILGEKKLSLNQ